MDGGETHRFALCKDQNFEILLRQKLRHLLRILPRQTYWLRLTEVFFIVFVKICGIASLIAAYVEEVVTALSTALPATHSTQWCN